MTPALVLFGYALAVAWCLPPLLVALTARGVSVRLGLAAWLSAMGSALLAAGLGIQSLFGTVRADWPSLTRALCRSMAGSACTPVVYRSALYELAVGAAAILVSAAAAVVLWRYGRRVQRAQRRTREHAEIARMAGRALPEVARTAGRATAPGHESGAAGARHRHGRAAAVVLDDPRPAAYCVPGRPAAIVLTSGALAVLDDTQLAAVLAHERAHLSGRHHAMVMATRALAAALPGVPLFTRGAEEVARLAEMSADDAAARRTGRGPLVTALLAIGTGTTVPGTALAAAAHAVPDRVDRLLRKPRPARDAAVTLALAASASLALVVPAVLVTLAG